MAWIRLDDNYNDHPKFDNLSDGAFRLWHQAVAFCRKYRTDGLVPIASVRKLKAYRAQRMLELVTPWKAGANPLWTEADQFVRVHDFLEWNPSKDEEESERSASTARMRRFRRSRDAVGDAVTNAVTRGRTNAFVPVRKGSGSSVQERGSGGKPDTALEPDEITERAGRFVERYGELYAEHRRGARHRARPNLDWMDACSLVPLWDDARLEKLAIVFLKTDDPWISKTDRSFKIFAMKATWADDRLKEWEEANGVTA